MEVIKPFYLIGDVDIPDVNTATLTLPTRINTNTNTGSSRISLIS